MALHPGARLGPYEVVSALGVGGMGEVYRARDTKLNRDVAIKVRCPPSPTIRIAWRASVVKRRCWHRSITPTSPASTGSKKCRGMWRPASFPKPGAKWQISDAGGGFPRWRADGKELFYWSDGRLMAATVRSEAGRMSVEAVQPLFEMRQPGGTGRSF